MHHRPYSDHQEPIYIGYEQPTNGLGIAGFVVSLSGLLVTFGLICPIGIALSFFGLFQRPRGLAVAGLLIGVVGTALPVVAGYTMVRTRHEQAEQRRSEAVTQNALELAQRRLAQFRRERDRVPEAVEGNKLVVRLQDGWDRELRYDRYPAERKIVIRSAGPDGEFETRDDVVRQWAVPAAEFRDELAVD